VTDLDSGSISSSPLGGFLRALFDRGEVTVERFSIEAPIADREVLLFLAEVDAQARVELAGDPPDYLPAASAWAAVQFYRACQLTVSRDIAPETVAQALGIQPPTTPQPDVCYSVDLVFRFLPDLYRLASQHAPDDILCTELRKWAHHWPLSSVGIRLEQDFTIAPFAESPALFQLYCDRVAAENAADRLGDSRVRARLQTDLGIHDEHFPSLARLLRPELTRPAR